MEKTEKYTITFWDIPIYLRDSDAVSSILDIAVQESYNKYKKYLDICIRTETVLYKRTKSSINKIQYGVVITFIRTPDLYEDKISFNSILKDLLDRLLQYMKVDNYTIDICEVNFSKFICDSRKI